MSDLTRLLRQRYQDTGDTLARQAAEEIDGQAWQPIETAPKDGTPFLCGWHSGGGYWYVTKAHWANGCVDGGWDGAREYIDVSPSHWMPIPRAPVQTSASGSEGKP